MVFVVVADTVSFRVDALLVPVARLAVPRKADAVDDLVLAIERAMGRIKGRVASGHAEVDGCPRRRFVVGFVMAVVASDIRRVRARGGWPRPSLWRPRAGRHRRRLPIGSRTAENADVVTPAEMAIHTLAPVGRAVVGALAVVEMECGRGEGIVVQALLVDEWTRRGRCLALEHLGLVELVLGARHRRLGAHGLGAHRPLVKRRRVVMVVPRAVDSIAAYVNRWRHKGPTESQGRGCKS